MRRARFPFVPAPLTRTTRLAPLVACAALVASAAAPTVVLADSHGGGTHELASDGSPLDLKSVALGQVDRELVLTVGLRRTLDRAELAAGKGRMCASFAQGDARHSLCVEREGHRWRLRSGSREIAGDVSQPSGDELVVRVRPADAHLRVGVLDWSVTATPASCAQDGAGGPPPDEGGAPAGGGGGVAPPSDTATTPEATTPPETAPPCRSRAPREAGARYPGRVWRVIVTGCVASGPAQVRRGPRVKRVALTYDDGPSSYTAPLLRTLKRLDAPATFFMLGEQVGRYRGLVRSMLADGFELANHSWNHANLGGGGPGASSQLSRTNAAIRRATGFTPCLFRPPYGSTGSDLVRRTRALGMTSVLWSADPLDWRTPGTDAIVARAHGWGARGGLASRLPGHGEPGAGVARVLAQTGPGAIILSHDGGGVRSQTLAAAPRIIRALRSRGYRFVTVSELLGYRERITLRR